MFGYIWVLFDEVFKNSFLFLKIENDFLFYFYVFGSCF